MRSLLNLLLEGKAYPLLSLYILYTLSKGPKSGYEIIKEIRAKTSNIWNPSKGTIYPVLYKLEEEGMIRREGENYLVTGKGLEMLREAREKRLEAHRKLRAVRSLAMEIFYPDELQRKLHLQLQDRVEKVISIVEKNPLKIKEILEKLDKIILEHTDSSITALNKK